MDIAGIKVPIDQATRAVLVPFRVAREPSWASLSCPEAVAHLKWMAQKEALDQDMFLIGYGTGRCSKSRHHESL